MKKVELKILELVFEDINRGYSILEISKKLNISYPLTHSTIKLLLKNRVVFFVKKGNALIIKINLKEVLKEHIYTELSRRDLILSKYHQLKSVFEKLQKPNQTQFICILFGSYAKKKPKKNSDIDLLFIIPDEYDYEKFDRTIRTIMTAHNTDINITPEKGVFEMWNTPKRFNVGNEILKEHVILKGAEPFLELRRRYEYG
ncbi:nucleotidyltransferase domain-containing protein [archaeon]|nr:nucleotidyltransferase domain-containing protein [archaeon]